MKKLKYLYILLVFMIIFIWFVVVSIPDSRLHIYACDVGQGDGFLITLGVNQIVVDGGPNNNISKCLSSHMPFWDRTLEAVIVTNPDRDHYYGFIEILNQYKVDNFISPGVEKLDSNYQQLLENVKKYDIKSTNLRAGDVIRVGNLDFDTLWPTAEALDSTSEINELSIVFILKYKNFKALFTGDIQPPAIQPLLEIGKVEDVDVLKVPHHGSKNGLTKELLQASKPEVALISSGLNNQWDHPNQETLDTLSSPTIKIYRTDQMGEIEVVSDGTNYQVIP